MVAIKNGGSKYFSCECSDGLCGAPAHRILTPYPDLVTNITIIIIMEIIKNLLEV